MYKILNTTIVLIAFMFFWVVPVCAAEVSSVVALFDHETSESIEILLHNRGFSSVQQISVSRLSMHEEILKLYQRRKFLPAWFDGWQLRPEALVLLESLRSAGEHGLCGDVYLLPELEGLIRIQRDSASHNLHLAALIRIQRDFARYNFPLAADNRAVLDLFLSHAFLTFATHLVEGQVDPALAHVDWRARRRKADLVKLLEYAIENRRVSQVLEDLLPPHEAYRQLISTLRAYQILSANGGWPEIPPGPTIRQGDNDDRVPLLRELLLKTGDLKQETVTNDDYDQETVIYDVYGQATATNDVYDQATVIYNVYGQATAINDVYDQATATKAVYDQATATKDVYDQATYEAMRIFQSRHGLFHDGVVGNKTLEELNVSVEERIRKIELNLERWRWMPKNFDKRYIRVNVADFSLEVIEDGEIVMQMPVIVGTQYRKTPVFSARMTYLEFAPYWTVPSTILREDKLPKIKRHPDYLEEKHFRILSRTDREKTIDPQTINWATVKADNFPGVLRMEPGPWNPLGRVKFMFPNNFNVYLHDTNETSLFDNNIRSFSSGCIRVKNPRALASYLVGKELGQKKLQALLEANIPKQVPIKPITVHIQYWTAWVDKDSLVHFRPDLYFRDLDLEVALAEPAYHVMEHLNVSAGKHLAKD